MLKKVVTYTDFNGDSRTEALYFHLSQTELMKLNFETGGVKDLLVEMVSKHDIAGITNLFDRLIRMSYGKKSQDGRNFVKRPEFTEDFVSTPAYDQIYMECISDENKAMEFMNGIMPEGVQANSVSKEQAMAFIENPYDFENQDLTPEIKQPSEAEN